MAPKAKKGKKSKKKKEPEEPIDPDLVSMAGDKLSAELAQIRDKLEASKIERNATQLEKDFIMDYYTNVKQEIDDYNAKIKNFDTSLQKLEEDHRMELKVYD